MPRTYEPIASQTLSSAATTVTFSDIPSTYTDLVIVANVKGSVGAYPQIQINGSGANLSRLYLVGNGSAASSSKASDNYIVGATNWNTGDSAFTTITHIFGYSNTTTFKTLLTRVSNASVGVEAVVNTWRSTSAVTSFAYYASSGNLAIGSTIALYGIKAA
jgi:hypothetical protein